MANLRDEGNGRRSVRVVGRDGDVQEPAAGVVAGWGGGGRAGEDGAEREEGGGGGREG